MRDKKEILEEYLVASARLGDRKAIARLAALRGPGLVRHAYRLLGNREDAHDAAQDAWIEIIRSLPGLRDHRAFRAWAYRIVTRRAAKLISAGRSRRMREAEAAVENDTVSAAQGPMAADASTIRKAIAALPPRQASAISLFYFDDMSIAEIAVALDAPPGTIKTRLMHARTKLTNALKGDLDDQA